MKAGRPSHLQPAPASARRPAAFGFSTLHLHLSTHRAAGGAMFQLLVFLAVLFAFAALAWMLFLPALVANQVRQRTGFDLTFERLVVNPFTGEIDARGIVVTNPPTYPVKDFLVVRRLTADVEMLTLLNPRPVVATATIELAKVTFVRREAGHNNTTAFQNRMLTGEENPVPVPGRAPKGMLVKDLTVALDELVVADHSGKVPSVQDFKLGFRHSYRDVSELKQLLAPSALMALLPAAPALKELLPGRLGEAVGEAAREAVQAAKYQEAAGSGEKSKGYFDALEESKKP
ncbi:MAG: hypothetical protein JSR48_04835 [Verrucomicrobia bacterium]|nr:hypothetical protein [Verrucomicrobiota bacterium]